MVNRTKPWGKPHAVSTTTPVENLDGIRGTINLAIYGDIRGGDLTGRIAKQHTITDKSFPLASFTVEVQHKKDESVDIVVTVDNGVISKTRHWL